MTATPPSVLAALSRFTALDLARLPNRPSTASTFAEIYTAYMADLAARLNAEGIPYDVAGTATNTVNLATDTYAITGRAFAYRVEQVETAIDDAICAVLLPWSYGAYLDGLGANQSPPVKRLPIVTNPRPYVAGTDSAADWQSDDVFRGLIQLAPEALSTCGPEGAYLWFVLAVPGILSAAAYGPMSFDGTRAAPFVGLGEVRIPILAGTGDGTASPALVAAAQAAVSGDGRRPIGDFVTVTSASVAPWSLAATLYAGPGIDLEAVGLLALARTRALADFQHRPGGAILLQDLYAALKVPDASGTPLIGFVDLTGFAEVNAVPISAVNPSGGYVAPYCPAGDGAPVVTKDDDGSLLIASGGLSLRVVQVYG